MQPASNMYNVSHAEELFGRLAYYGVELRKGQKRFIEYVSDHPSQSIYNGVLPTGYGKSKTAECVCHILKQQGRANRFLFVVPTDTQRAQYATGIAHDVMNMGLNLKLLEYRNDDVVVGKPIIVDHSTSIHRANRENRCDVYITTVQSIVCNEGFYADLMSTGRWALFCDEYQKLNKEEDAKWGKAIENLNHSVMFGLTATPIRTDKKATVFAEKEPDVEVSFEDAYKEKAIRGVVAHVEHYFVDVKNDDGGVDRITTDNITSYDLSKDLRFTTKYISSILTSAYGCLTVKNLAHENQHQMLVFAMSVHHAKAVSDVLNVMFGDGFSNWVGVGNDGRPKNENEAIIEKYKKNKLPCLVQVDLAGEGFDNPRSSVLVFLHLLKKATVKAVQQAGRGVRRNYNITDFPDDVCDIFASPDTEMAELAVEFAKRTIDAKDIGTDKTSGGGTKQTQPKQPPIYTIPPFESFVVDSEYDRSEIVSKITQSQVDGFRLGVERSEGKSVADTISDERLMSILVENQIQQMKKAEAIDNREECYRNKVDGAVKTLAGNVCRLRYGDSAPKTAVGDLITKIHRQWTKQSGGMKHKSMLDEDFKVKHDWIVETNEGLKLTREIPVWLQL